MSDPNKSVAEALLQAIKAERDGTQFYMMAARTCEDAKGKEIFELLAAEEVDHQRYLQIQYRSVQKTGKIDGTQKLGRRGVLEGESPIFSPAIKARIGEAHFEMSALSIGIQLEQSAMAYYSQAADQALEALAFAQAEHHYTRALELKGAVTDDASRTLHERRGDALTSLGRGVDAAAEYALAAQGSGRDERLRLSILRAQRLIRAASRSAISST